MRTPPLDGAKLARFEAKLLCALNGAALALMTSIGHRAGLFDVMSGCGRPAPADRRRGGARPALRARVARRDGDRRASSSTTPARDAYALPAGARGAAHAAPRGPTTWRRRCQWIPLLGSVEDPILECFERGGGVPYVGLRALPRGDGRGERPDRRRRARRARSCRSCRARDGARARHRRARRRLRQRPRAEPAGGAIPAQPLRRLRPLAPRPSRRRAPRRASSGSPTCASRCATSPSSRCAAFDLVTAFDAIHDQARPAAVLAAIARALRDDGVFLMQDIAGTSRLHEDAPLRSRRSSTRSRACTA